MELAEILPLLMFAALAVLLFSGYPVAFVLGGIGLAFGFIGMAFDEFQFALFGVIPSRVFGGIAESLILTAIPMFIFMGTMLEKSGAARDLLNCLQVLLRRVPGGLALAVTLMGTIMAATTGIIGASVVMMTLLSLPVMMERKYDFPLATGTIAASGTLGILIPPSIMLVIMADLLGRSVGNLFVAAVFPGLMLAGFYVLFKGKNALKIKLRFLKPDSGTLKKICVLGWPATLEHAMRAVGFMLLISIVAGFGTVFVAAYSVGMRIVHIFIMPSLAMSMGVSAGVGQNLGAVLKERAMKPLHSLL